MTTLDAEKLVQRLQILSRTYPDAFRMQVWGVIMLGYVALHLLWITSLLLLCFIGWVTYDTLSTGHFEILFLAKFLLFGALGIVGLFLMVFRLLFYQPKLPHGFEVSEKDAPRLFALLDEVRKKTKARRFSHVYLNTELNACVVYLPRGEEVYQLALDLNGDSKPTIFLTFKKWGSRTGNVWIAYTPVEGGYNRVQDAPGSAGIVFRPNGFYAIDPKGGLFVLISGRDGGDLVHYDIKNGVATMQKVQTIDYDKSEDKKNVEKILGHKLEDRASDDHPSYKVLMASAIEAESK